MGCMAPVYFVHPSIPHYPWPDDDLGGYLRKLFAQHGELIKPEAMQPGDVVLMKWPMGLVHPGVYLGRGEVLHSRESSGWEIININRIRAIEGVYRYAGRDGVL